MVSHVSVFDETSVPGERPTLTSRRLSPEEQRLVGAYLEAGAVVMHTTARGIDVLDGDAPVVPLTVRTDGEFVWTGPVTYYVTRYGVAPDPRFLHHVRSRGYEPRVPDEAEVHAVAEELTGGA